MITVQGVPLIQSVSRQERVGMISQSLIKEFREGEYIIKQGEVGEELFIILEGACDVVEDKNFAKSNSKEALDRDRDSEVTAPNLVKLVTLREGHFFGEMSLMTVSKRITVCVIMCVSVFVCVGVTVSEIVCEFYPLFHHVPYFFPHCPIRPSLPHPPFHFFLPLVYFSILHPHFMY